jgi:hypothetical protein
VVDAWGAAPQDDPGKDVPPPETEPGTKENAEAPPPPASIDEGYVRDKLEAYLVPTKLEFPKLIFEFSEKKKEHEAIFTPPVSQVVNTPFRWSLRREEAYYSSSTYNAETKTFFSGGLRVSDAGMALLNCWFTDDVEAEITYHQGTSFSPTNIAAVIFSTEKGDALGSNFGSQAAIYKKGKATTKRQGAPEPLNIYDSTKVKLVVRGGMFEAQRNGRKKEGLEYTQKTFGSGRVGFLWGGRVAGMISRLEITGRIDAAKMAKEMQKGSR